MYIRMLDTDRLELIISAINPAQRKEKERFIYIWGWWEHEKRQLCCESGQRGKREICFARTIKG